MDPLHIDRTFDLKHYLAKNGALVDSYLKEYFSNSGIRPPLLRESMEYSISAGGKRIRPVLALASYEACGGKRPEGILRYACALELIHTYSLIHDDLPAMDDDDLRRGKPTNHKVYGEAMAILAGDGLLTEAFHMLSLPGAEIKMPEGVLLEIIADLAARAGLWGMVAGQAQDILSDSAHDGLSDSAKDGLSGAAPQEAAARMGPVGKSEIEFIHMHKTAQLITASVRMGGMLAGAGPERLQALTGYGQCVGLAFQVADDILDVKGETALMGKTAGSDERKKKLTYPSVLGMEAAEAEARDLVEKAFSSLEGVFGPEAEPLRAIARYIIEREK